MDNEQSKTPGARTEWPKSKDVSRCGDMAPHGEMVLRVLMEDDGDVIVAATEMRHGELRTASCEFCTVGGGGGRSSRTRMALIALMVAIEADNADCPHLAWPATTQAAKVSA